MRSRPKGVICVFVMVAVVVVVGGGGGGVGGGKGRRVGKEEKKNGLRSVCSWLDGGRGVKE